MATNNLLRTELAPGQTDNQYAVVNTSDGDIDSAITKKTSVLVSTTSPVVINRGTLTKCIELSLDNHGTPPSANFDVTLDNETSGTPYPRGLILISNNTSFVATISAANQSLDPVEIEAGGGRICYLSETDVIVVTAQSLSEFIQLTDVPSSYTGAAGYLVQVSADATSLIFRDPTQGVETSAARWRVLVTASNDATPFLSIGDIEFREFVGVAETMTTVGGTATASPPYFGGDPATLLFNGLTNVRYAFLLSGGFGAGQFCQFEFTTPRVVRELCMKAPDAFFGEMAKDWLVQYWTGAVWVTVLSVTNETGWTSGQSRTYGISYPGGFVNKAGDTMSGALTLPGNPSSALEAAPKQYVDTMVPLAGGTMTGALTLFGDPTSALHAVPKRFVRERLTAARTYYVRADGSDSNTGLVDSAGGAFLTIQAAFNAIGMLDLGGQIITLQVRDGTFAGAALRGPVIGDSHESGGAPPLIRIVGNTGTPANCIITSAFTTTHGARLQVTGGFRFSGSGGLIANQHGYIVLAGACEFHTCTGSHFFAQNYGVIYISTTAYTINGGAQAHYRVRSAGQFQTTVACTVTISSTPAFSIAFVLGESSGVLALIFAVTFSGAATGRRYQTDSTFRVTSGSSIIDYETYFPGDVRGTTEQNYFSLSGGFRNLIINPQGRVQDGPSGSIADGVYGLHNCWYALTQANPITPSTVTDVEDGTPFLMRLTQANASAQRMGYAQIIEDANCKHLRGRQVCISGRIRCSQAITIRWAVIEWTSTANAPTKDVVNNWASGTFTAGNFFISSNVIITHTGSLALSANTLTVFAGAPFLLGSTFNNLYVVVWANSTLAQNETLDFLAQLEEGLRFTRPERRHIQIDRDMASRYRQRKTVRTENGSRHIPLLPMLTTPTVTPSVGTAGNITANGFELTHTSAADSDIDADCSMGV